MHYDNDIYVEHLFVIFSECLFLFLSLSISNNNVDNVMDKHEATTNPNWIVYINLVDNI